MKIVGLVLVALALAVAIVPQFTDCESQGNAIALPNGKTIPMKCHWTGQGELAIAGPLAMVGVLKITSRRRHALRALSIVGIVLGAAVILLPTVLIGVCGSNLMLCNIMMKPTLIMAGILTVTASLAGLLLSRQAAFEPPVPERDAE